MTAQTDRVYLATYLVWVTAKDDEEAAGVIKAGRSGVVGEELSSHLTTLCCVVEGCGRDVTALHQRSDFGGRLAMTSARCVNHWDEMA